MPYYIVANKEIEKHWEEYQNEVVRMGKEAIALMKALKAKNYLLNYEMGVKALIFDKDFKSPDWKLYDKCRYDDVFCPKRNTKEGKRLHNLFVAIQPVSMTALNIACGFKNWVILDDGRCFRSPSLEEGKNKELILHINDAVIINENEAFVMPHGIEELTLTKYQEIKRVKNEKNKM